MKMCQREPSPMTREQVRVVEAEIDRQRIVRSLVRVAVGNSTTPDEYRAMMVRERYRMQEYEGEPGLVRRVMDAVLVGWAMIWLGLCGLSERLTREV